MAFLINSAEVGVNRSGRLFQVERLEIRERREIEIVIFNDLTIFIPFPFAVIVKGSGFVDHLMRNYRP